MSVSGIWWIEKISMINFWWFELIIIFFPVIIVSNQGDLHVLAMTTCDEKCWLGTDSGACRLDFPNLLQKLVGFNQVVIYHSKGNFANYNSVEKTFENFQNWDFCVDFVSFLKPLSFLNFWLFRTNKHIIRKSSTRKTSSCFHFFHSWYNEKLRMFSFR